MSAVTMHHFSGLAAPFVRSKGTVSGGVFTLKSALQCCNIVYFEKTQGRLTKLQKIGSNKRGKWQNHRKTSATPVVPKRNAGVAFLLNLSSLRSLPCQATRQKTHRQNNFYPPPAFSLRVEYLLPITILSDFEHRKSPSVKLTEGDRFPIVAGVQIEFG